MSRSVKPQNYRDAIEELVHMCRDGQGQIGARRLLEGVWNEHASEHVMPEQHQVNLLLSRLSPADREIIAGLLTRQVETGVFETLKVLEQFGIEPFTDGYEGSPYNDFVGRLDDWSWPQN